MNVRAFYTISCPTKCYFSAGSYTAIAYETNNPISELNYVN